MSAKRHTPSISTVLAALLVVGLLHAAALCATAAELERPSDRTLYRSWVDAGRYTGAPASAPATATDFRQLAFELQRLRERRRAAGASVAQPDPYERVSAPRNNLRDGVPLSLIHWRRTLETVTPEQQRLALSTGVAPQPTLTNVTVFAVSPLRPVTYRGASARLSLAAGDLFEETGTNSTLRALRVDPGDGSGWRALEVGQEVPAAYATPGTKTVSVEATLSDGTVLRASAPLDVAALATPDFTTSARLVADAPYNNTTGTLYIYKSGDHAGLRCPVLVAEGFDMQNNMDWDALYNLLNGQQLAETLRAYGRDLLVLDYTNAMRNIFENAALARKAVNYVNANRHDAADPFTVIGASMGGLVTRIALADMDRAPAAYGASHVNTWISFDSPHKGANIPLGIQEFLAFFSDKNSEFAAAAELLGILNQPAAKQMLLAHYSSSATLAGNSSNTAFQAALDAKGFPTSCKRIAVSNGSGLASRQPFDPGQRVMYWHYRDFWSVDVDGHVYALSTVPSPVPTVFYGFWDTIVPFDEATTTQKHYAPYALDNAPGGSRDSFKVLFDSTASLRGSDDYCLWPDHCFIPTASSLGISMAYYDVPIASTPGVLALSPFDELHCATTNEPHISINAGNTRWFMRALLQNYDTDADGFDDYQEYLVGTDYASAASKLTGATVRTAAIDSGSMNLEWSVRPNVTYQVYFTETLAHDWVLVETGYWMSAGWAGCQLPLTTPSGFYKIVSEIKDPVTD